MTTIYLPIIRGPYTKSDPSPYTSELSLAGMTREFIVADIRSGQIENVDRILEINEADGTCRDATTDIANDVCDATWGAQEEPFADLRKWLDYHSNSTLGPYVAPVLRYRGSRSDPYYWVAE